MTEYKGLAFEVIECCNCHVQFCVTIEHKQDLYNSKERFFCPNGHSQSYTGKSNKQVINELKGNINTYKIRRNELQSELEVKEKSIKAYKMLYCKEKKKAQKQD